MHDYRESSTPEPSLDNETPGHGSPVPEVEFKPVRSPYLRALLLSCGWVAVALGVVGIFLPVVPTTPFLLLAAACFVRSSRRLYTWLIGHRRLGPYLTYYLDGQGMPYRAKLYTLGLMWSTMAVSAWLVGNAWVAFFMLISGLCVSIYIARMPARERSRR